MSVRFTHEAEFRRERDFGTKVSTTFEFITAQFRPLMKCLAYFVLPPALLFGVGLGLVFNGFMSMVPLGGSRLSGPGLGGMTLGIFSGFGLAFLGAMLAFLLISSTVYGFVRVRMNTPAQQEVQPAQVWAYMRPRLGRVVLAWLLFLGLGIVAMLVMGLFVGLMGAVLGQSPGFAVLLMFLVFIPLVWAVVALSLYFPALWIEDTDVWTALRRCFYLVYGKWWSSFGLYFVVAFIQSFLSYLFAIPMYGVIMLKALRIPGFDSGILSIATVSLYSLGLIFTSVLTLVAMLFQYFNLVERKEGLGLRLMVNSLGQTAAPQASNAAYQPDEEGEY